jgi:ferritin-like metal-binding protein YciE
MLSEHFREHLVETEWQAEMVRDRLEAAGGSPSKLKDAVMRLGGKGFLLFARMQPDTPGKLAAHAHSYEALELASYEMLIRMARRAGDDVTARVAATIREQERAMRDRLAGDFDEAVDASLRAVGKEASDTLDTYLADAHALEEQSIQLLERGEKIAGDPALARIYADHLEESRKHARLIEDRLGAMDESTSTVKDAGLRVGALNWSLFFTAQGDTAAKLAAFVYAVEHLEIGGYELLRRVAQRAGDTATVQLADGILADERAMADRVFGAFDLAFEASVDG